MKRRLRNISILLVLGGILNIGLAWGTAFVADYQTASFVPWADVCTPSPYQALAEDHRSVSYFGAIRSRGSGDGVAMRDFAPYWSIFQRVETPQFRGAPANAFEMASGWPCRSFSATCLYLWMVPNAGSVVYGYELEPVPHVRMIPTRPIWPGFVANSLLFAAVLGLLWWGFAATRNLLRHTKGCCNSCGYDLRGADHDACPECGAPVVAGHPQNRISTPKNGPSNVASN